MKDMQSTFLAWVFRMPLIKRWGLMHCYKPEDVSQHSHQVGVLAHLLAVIRNTRYGGNLDPQHAATLALFHEISETKLQDLNHVTKYHNPEFTKQFKRLEMLAEVECLETLPEDLRDSYAKLIVQDNVDARYHDVVKAADVISAYLKATDEQRLGNPEFEHVVESLSIKLGQFSERMPEVRDCMEIFAASCLATLDQISDPSPTLSSENQ